MGQLSVGSIVTEGIKLGLANMAALLVNILLFALTFWIPYLNVGTTIGLVGMVAKVGKGESLSMTEIFNPAYRKYMGEFFLTVAFVTIGIFAGMSLLIIPGYVIGLAWSQAVLLVLDKGMDPISALKKSNDITYGKKWTIFLGHLALMLAVLIAVAIVAFIGSKIHVYLGMLFFVVGYLAFFSIMMGAQGYVYKTLTE